MRIIRERKKTRGMEDEFDQLMRIFSEESEEKEKKLDEIFQRSTEFFDKYKYIIAKGSEEDKKEMQKKMNILRERLKKETVQTEEKLGVSSEEVKNLASNSKNFTQKQWNFLQNAQDKLFKEKSEQIKKIELAKQERIAELQQKKKKKPVSRKSGWMKS